VTTTSDVLLVGDLASVHVRRLAAGLRDAGLTVHLAGFNGDPIDGVSVHSLGSRPASSDRRYGLAIPRLARIIRDREPAIVHAHYLTSFGLMATLALRLAHPVGRAPSLVQTVWGTDILVTARRSRIHRALAKVSLRSASLVTGDSLEVANEVVRYAPRSRFHRFVFGPPDALLDAPRHPEGIILSSRRLDPDTRIDVVIEGYRRAKDRTPRLADWTLTVAGKGRDAERLRTLASDRDDIRFVGELDAAHLHSMLLSAEAFVSIPLSDGTSATVLESMAAGATPIVNALPANLEWVDPEIGVIVPASPTAEDVASAIEVAQARHGDPAAVRARVRNATWEHEIARLIEAYGTIRPVRNLRAHD
jgi:L-malate glycosyltransferase